MGLREKKKSATRERIRLTALDLFEANGFDDVSVAEVAEAAEVSKMTVFNYFPVKEDLVTGVAKHHIDEPATVVRSRAERQTPLDAMRNFFLASLAQREPYTGLNDWPEPLRIQRLVYDTPALMMRYLDYRHQAERLLAEALIEESTPELMARLVAAQILGAQQVLAVQNRERIVAGESADSVYPDAVSNADETFRLLEHGLGSLLRR